MTGWAIRPESTAARTWSTSVRAAPARSRHQPVGRDPTTLAASMRSICPSLIAIAIGRARSGGSFEDRGHAIEKRAVSVLHFRGERPTRAQGLEDVDSAAADRSGSLQPRSLVNEDARADLDDETGLGLVPSLQRFPLLQRFPFGRIRRRRGMPRPRPRRTQGTRRSRPRAQWASGQVAQRCLAHGSMNPTMRGAPRAERPDDRAELLRRLTRIRHRVLQQRRSGRRWTR